MWMIGFFGQTLAVTPTTRSVLGRTSVPLPTVSLNDVYQWIFAMTGRMAYSFFSAGLQKKLFKALSSERSFLRIVISGYRSTAPCGRITGRPIRVAGMARNARLRPLWVPLPTMAPTLLMRLATSSFQSSSCSASGRRSLRSFSLPELKRMARLPAPWDSEPTICPKSLIPRASLAPPGATVPMDWRRPDPVL